MRRARPLLAALLFAGFGAQAAQAFGLSQVQMPLPRWANSMDRCLAHGRGVLERAGLNILGNNENSVGGEPRDATALATIFCVMEGGVAVISVAGEGTSTTDPLALRLREAWQSRGGK